MTLLNLSNQSINNLNFNDKTYLITGAANGIGKALAHCLSDLQAAVILLDKDDSGLNNVYDEISSSKMGEPVIVHQDLCQLTQAHCDDLAGQIQQSFGKLNAIIHCAAETGHLAPVDHYLDKDWSNVMSANLHAPYILTRTLKPLLDVDDQPTVIFTLSEQARKSTAFWGAFAAAQQGLKGLVESWSDETESAATRLIMLDPGKVNTDFLLQLYPGLDANNYPKANDITNAYLVLLKHSNDLHGKFLQIDNQQLKVLN